MNLKRKFFWWQVAMGVFTLVVFYTTNFFCGDIQLAAMAAAGSALTTSMIASTIATPSALAALNAALVAGLAASIATLAVMSATPAVAIAIAVIVVPFAVSVVKRNNFYKSWFSRVVEFTLIVAPMFFTILWK